MPENPNLKNVFESLPMIQAGKLIHYNPRYHQYSIFGHTQKVVRHLYENGASNNLIAAGYLHDIGKVVLSTPKGEGLYSLGSNHAHIGATIILEMNPSFFTDLELDQQYIAHLVENHEHIFAFVRSMREQSIDVGTFTNRLAIFIYDLDTDPHKTDKILLYEADCIGKGNVPDREEMLAYVPYLKGKSTGVLDLYRQRYVSSKLN